MAEKGKDPLKIFENIKNDCNPISYLKKNPEMKSVVSPTGFNPFQYAVYLNKTEFADYFLEIDKKENIQILKLKVQKV